MYIYICIIIYMYIYILYTIYYPKFDVFCVILAFKTFIDTVISFSASFLRRKHSQI